MLVAAASAVAGTKGDYFKRVRPEFSGIPNDFGTTVVFITNQYANQSIRMRNVYVLGASGVNSLIATRTSLAGVTIPPLEVIRIAIDNTIPGVTVEDSWNGSGVRSVAVGWTGSDDGASVGAVAWKRLSGTTSDKQSHIIAEGVPILWQ